MLVVLDTQTLQFRKDTGEFVKAFTYERAQPDGSYDNTSHGENSYVLDEKRGLLYLVQGYRILELTLKSGEVKELFRQDYADIGNITLHEGDLLFSLNPGGRWNSTDNPGNELVRYSLSTGKSQRYPLPTTTYSGELDGNTLIMLTPSKNGNLHPSHRLPLDFLP